MSFVYDKLRRVTSTTDVWGQALNYTYDANDRRTKLSFGATTNATYTYDVVNRLTKITDSANLVVAFAYDSASKLTSKTLPNGVATTYTYDGLDRLTRLKDAKGTTVIADNNYTFNNAGDITQNIDQSGTHVYGYDTIDRLTSATYTGTPNETYAYDGVGNRTSSHKSASYGYQPFNRLVSTSTASYIYNNNGNMISKTDSTGTTQFAWDFENRLTQVVTPASGSVTYKYDALGRRIQRTPSSGISTNFVYDGQDVVKDINSDGTTVEYLNGPGIDNKIRQKGSSSSTTYYLSQDHLGSTTALTGTTGKLVERVTYDGYGNSAGSTRTRYGYTGRERDSLTGLLYYRARFYDPQVGRFISEDLIGFDGGQDNFYAYVANNSINRKDPQGLDIAVIENGATAYTPFWGGNPAGHTAIAISCHGLYSFGNGTQRGSSLLDYLRREAPRRDTRIYVIKSTCAQDQAAMQATWDYGDTPLQGVLSDNCSTRVNHALDAARIGPALNTVLPGSAGARAGIYGGTGAKVTVYEVPQNSRVNFLPPDLAQFEPKNSNDCSCKCKQ